MLLNVIVVGQFNKPIDGQDNVWALRKSRHQYLHLWDTLSSRPYGKLMHTMSYVSNDLYGINFYLLNSSIIMPGVPITVFIPLFDVISKYILPQMK